MAKHQRSHGLPAPLHTPAARPESSEPRDISGSRARSVDDSEHQIGQTGCIGEAAAKTVLEQASVYRRENGESIADRKGAGTRTILDATEPTSRRDSTMDRFRILAGFPDGFRRGQGGHQTNKPNWRRQFGCLDQLGCCVCLFGPIRASGLVCLKCLNWYRSLRPKKGVCEVSAACNWYLALEASFVCNPHQILASLTLTKLLILYVAACS